jgi:hypothetical protein
MRVLCVAVLSFVGATVAADPGQVSLDNAPSPPPSSPSTGAPNSIAVGQRVRITSATLKGRVDAVVASFDDKSVTVSRKKGGPLAIPWASVSAVDVQDGYRRPLLESAGIGAAIGAVIGVFVHLDKTCHTPEEMPSDVCSRAEAIGGAAAGMSLLFFGSQFLAPAEHYDHPKWKRLSPPYQPVALSLRLVPLRHGVGARVTLRF